MVSRQHPCMRALEAESVLYHANKRQHVKAWWQMPLTGQLLLRCGRCVTCTMCVCVLPPWGPNFAGVVRTWDTASGACVQALEGPGGAVEWVAWHPRGDVVLAGADDFTAWMWQAATGQCMQVRAAGSGPRCGLCWTASDVEFMPSGGVETMRCSV